MTEITYALFVFLVALQAGDVLTTNKLLSKGGREANPLMLWVMSKLGSYWWSVKVALMLALGYLVYQLPNFHMLLALAALNLLYLWVVLHNYRQLS